MDDENIFEDIVDSMEQLAEESHKASINCYEMGYSRGYVDGFKSCLARIEEKVKKSNG